MDFQDAFYAWAIEWAESEWMRDFPLISGIASPLAQNYVHFVRSLPAQEQRNAVGAILRRFHIAALRSAPLSEVESTYVNRYLDQPIRPLGARKKFEPIDYRQVMTALSSRFKGATVEGEDGDIEMLMRGKRWDLRTTIGVVKAPGRIVYHHDIEKGKQVFLGQWVSILGWMGVAGQSEWSEITNAAIATATLVQSIEVFLESPLVRLINE